VLFDNLDLAVYPGQLLELRGANGSGKTTLLRCLAGMTADYMGHIKHPPDFLVLGHRPGFSAELTAVENLQWYCALRGRQVADARLRVVLDAVGLAHLGDSLAGNLSAGQQRRLALARLSLEEASVWLLDEPTASMDTAGMRMLRELCEAHLRTGGAVVLSTHLDMGFSCARRVLRLDDSQSQLPVPE